jgi:Na+-driven multidrug efflux pump
MGKESSLQSNPLATEPIGKLIVTYAVPCVISLVVNGLYNIVDQIFIGRAVGYLGNTATNVVFPLTILCVALGVLFGDGTATYLNLKLGEGRREDANKGVANGILMSVTATIIFLVVSAVFLKPIIKLFGCTETAEPYALGYGSIVLIGFPFVMISTTLNSIIRADGNPKLAMISLAFGAVLNTILDPIFIFVLGWGVQGAAFATIIGQIVAFFVSLS